MLVISYKSTNPNVKFDNDVKKLAKKHGWKFFNSCRDMKTNRRDLLFVDKGDNPPGRLVSPDGKPLTIKQETK